jgi:hypothetical protein
LARAAAGDDTNAMSWNPARTSREQRGVDGHLRAACDEIEIAPVSSNDLRRTFSSWLEQAGVPRSTNARLMRHTTTAMVDKVYAQSAPDQLAAAVDHLPQTHVVAVTNRPHADDGEEEGPKADASR